MSWLRTRAGYELFCNRDERLTRLPARPPALLEAEGVRFLAPVDGDFGGSWIGVNEAGLSLCVLNRHDDAAGHGRELSGTEHEFESRGLLLTSLMHCRSVAEAMHRVESAHLSRFRPFTLFAIAPDRAPLAAHWTGRRLSFETGGDSLMPLTSSSYEPADVAESRKKLFRQLTAASHVTTADVLLDFHRSHAPARGPVSVCMHRDDAATVSFSRVRVSEGLVEFSYRPGAPCSGARALKVSLPRTRQRERRRAAEGSETWHCRLL
ncbi:MAG: NRDE family protein [Rubrivivax sp.]|nr:NRDE family protein [Pyrinomonadaceae bacterium]